MIQRLFGEKTRSHDKAAQLGAELNLGLVGGDREQFLGESEEEARTSADLTPRHTGLDEVVPLHLKAGHGFQTVHLVLLLAALSALIVLAAHVAAAEQRNTAHGDHI